MMRSRVLVLVMLLALGSCSPQGRASMMDTRLQPDLETIRNLRVYFGHQSVGGNILEGVAALSRQAGLPFSFTNINSPGRPAAFFSESLIGRNGEPASKCESFRQWLERIDGQVD